MAAYFRDFADMLSGLMALCGPRIVLISIRTTDSLCTTYDLRQRVDVSHNRRPKTSYAAWLRESTLW